MRTSRKLCGQLSNNIKRQISEYAVDEMKLNETRNEIATEREKRNSAILEDLKTRMTSLQIRALELSQRNI